MQLIRQSSFGSSDFFVFTSMPFFSIFGSDSGTGNVVRTIGTASSIASASASTVVGDTDLIGCGVTRVWSTDLIGCDVTGVLLIFINLASSNTSKLVVDIDACAGDDGSPSDDIITLKTNGLYFQYKFTLAKGWEEVFLHGKKKISCSSKNLCVTKRNLRNL